MKRPGAGTGLFLSCIGGGTKLRLQLDERLFASRKSRRRSRRRQRSAAAARPAPAWSYPSCGRRCLPGWAMASAAGSAGGSFADGSPGSSFSWRRSSSFRPSRIVLNSSGPSSPGRSVRDARGRNATPAQTSVMPIVISEMPRPVMRANARKARDPSSLRFELSALPGCGPE